jgi:cyclopropane-fatty-acyl-phospholipid synthase
MFGAGTEKALAEAYLRDDFDILGNMEDAFDIEDALAGAMGLKQSIALAFLLRRLPTVPRPTSASRAPIDRNKPRHSIERDRHAIAYHYDVSNDFYRLWLDRRMVYSCGYFEDASRDLESAQTAKLEYLCRKLRLQEGQEVLDIGCGWGGLAMYAAEHYRVNVTGVTLSREQADWAAERASRARLGGRVRIRCQDYRALEKGLCFDAAVSVGMSEHVGREKLPEYFSGVWALLKPGGVFLNHAIGEGCRYRPSRGPSFIDEYVFPDSDIPPIESVLASAAASGFEVRDVENLREHYALTLRHWVRRLESSHDEAVAVVSEATYRVWRLYMAGSAHGFDRGRLAVYQVLLARPDEKGRSHLPLTRKGWYAPETPDGQRPSGGETIV